MTPVSVPAASCAKPAAGENTVALNANAMRESFDFPDLSTAILQRFAPPLAPRKRGRGGEEIGGPQIARKLVEAADRIYLSACWLALVGRLPAVIAATHAGSRISRPKKIACALTQVNLA